MLDTFRKLRALLNPRERRQALLLLAMMLVVGLVEVAGVASIFPLIAVLSDPSLVETNRWLKLVYDGLGFTELNAFFIFLSAAVFVIVVGRTALTALSSYALLRFSSMRSHSLSTRLLETYLRHDYAWFLNRHSADLGKSVFSEVGEVIGGSLVPAMQLVSQAIIAVCIVTLVVLIDPVVASVAVVVLGLAYGTIYLGIRNLLTRIGSERVRANRERFRIAQEALGGIKEVKVGGLERGYLRRFSAASFIFERRRSALQALAETPRHALEVIAIGGMLIVILALLLRNQGSMAAALPAMAVYAFAGLRLLPVVQGLYKALVALRASGPALDRLREDFAQPQDGPDLRPAEPMPLTRAIELRNVRFAYPAAQRTALNDINLTIPVHTTVGIVGKTGAGKSTLIDILLGLLTPQAGQLLVDGVPIDAGNVRAWQRSIGYVPQHIFLADESLAANIAFGVPEERIDMAAVERAARMACLHEFIVEELPDGYATRVGERGVRLSGGQRQRVGIARALYQDPAVLILDEATSALDTATEASVIQAVRNIHSHKTIIMITHRPNTVDYSDNVVKIDGGRIQLTIPPREASVFSTGLDASI